MCLMRPNDGECVSQCITTVNITVTPFLQWCWSFFFLDAKSEPQLSNSHCFWIYQGTNISHLGKRKIIFKNDFWWDMSYVSYQEGNNSKNMKESHLATGFMKHRESGHGIIIWWYVVFLSAAWRRLQQEHWASLKHLPIEWVHEQLTAIKTVLWLKRISSWFVGWPLFIHSFHVCLWLICIVIPNIPWYP